MGGYAKMSEQERLYKAIPQDPCGVSWQSKKCFWCGEHLIKGQSLVIIVIAFQFKQIYKKLSSNVVMHKGEFDALEAKYGSNHSGLITELGNHVTPRKKKEYMVAQMKRQQAFKEVCYAAGYRIETETRSEIKMKMHKTSKVMVYDKDTDRISFRYQGKKGMFDHFFVSEIVGRIENGVRESLGQPVLEVESAIGQLNNIVSNAKKMMNE